MDVRMNRCTAGMWIDGSTNGAEADAELAANERMDGGMDGWMYG